jgi:hypothetical protein
MTRANRSTQDGDRSNVWEKLKCADFLPHKILKTFSGIGFNSEDFIPKKLKIVVVVKMT